MTEAREKEILEALYQILKENIRGDEIVVKNITVRVYQFLLEQKIIK